MYQVGTNKGIILQVPTDSSTQCHCYSATILQVPTDSSTQCHCYSATILQVPTDIISQYVCLTMYSVLLLMFVSNLKLQLTHKQQHRGMFGVWGN